MLRKVVGKGKKKAPPKTLEDTSKAFDARVANIDAKALVLDKKIRDIKIKMKGMPKNSPAYNAQKKRALQLLKQRKMYDKQGDTARQQQFNIDQQQFQIESMQATQEQVATMKETKKVMKKQMKTINIDKVEDLKADIDDIMLDNNEVQDILAENEFDGIDEEDLDAELEGFDEYDENLLDVGVDNQVPDYLNNDMLGNELPAAPQHTGAVDEFGLPPAPVPAKPTAN